MAQFGTSRLLQAIFAVSRDGLVLLDLSGRVRHLNAAGAAAFEVPGASVAVAASDFESVSGTEEDDAPDLEWGLLWPEALRETARASIAKARAGETVIFTGYRTLAQGHRLTFEVSLAPVLAEDGGVAMILAGLRETTAGVGAFPAQDHGWPKLVAALSAQLAAESERLSEARAHATHTGKLKVLGESVGHIVHDLNNIFAIMISACRLISKRSAEDAERILSHAEASVMRGANLLRQLLQFARFSNEVFETAHLGKFLERELPLIQHLAGPLVAIELDYPPDLWNVLVDANRLQGVVFNLVANSRDAMTESGSLKLSLANCPAQERPGVLADGDYVVLSVADTGSGMPPEVIARAGEPFFTTKDRGRGTGLGLASAFEFASQNGGRVFITSEAGRGTQVSLYIARAQAQGDAVRADPNIDANLHGSATILLAEDDEGMRKHLAQRLRALHYAVIEASSTEVALAQVLQTPHVDLLISGSSLGPGPEDDLATRARQLIPGLPVIFITGQRHPSMPAGSPVLVRPVSETALAQAVLACLGRLPGMVDVPEEIA